MSSFATDSSESKRKFSLPELSGLGRSIGLGGLVGTLAAYFVLLRFPQLIIDPITVKQGLFFGGALGACLHGLATSLIGNPFLKPLYKGIAYYTLFTQLELQYRFKQMDDADYHIIRRRLVRGYYLAEPITSKESAVEVSSKNEPPDEIRQVERKPIAKRPRVIDSIKASETGTSDGEEVFEVSGKKRSSKLG